MKTLHQNITDTLKWVNPETNVGIKLGSMMAENMVINPEYIGLLSKILPFDNMSFEKHIGEGGEGNLYTSRFEDKEFVFKIYKNKDILRGIEQFRCLRKIKILGYETPEVYVATNDILLMDYIPHPTIRDYIHNKNTAENMGRIFEVWYPQMIKIRSILWDENLDIKDGNGYVIQDTPEVKIGIFDQG